MQQDYFEEVLTDEWRPERPIPLDGFAERNGFGPGAMMFIGLLLALFLFQVVFSPLFLFLILMLQGLAPAEILGRLGDLLAENVEALLIANSLGQVFGLALVGLLLARLHTSKPMDYLYFREPDGPILVYSVVGLLGMLPVVQWLARINDQMPLPNWLREMDEASVELIRQLLLGDLGLGFSLFALALVPAICEEILFRGYVQRQAQRRFGVAAAIVITGVIFGLYHLRFTQLLPLSALGIYIGYVLWRSGSLWAAMAVHFANNAILIVVSDQSPQPDDAPVAGDLPGVPWYGVVVGILVTAAAIYAMHQRAVAVLPSPSRTGQPASETEGDNMA